MAHRIQMEQWMPNYASLALIPTSPHLPWLAIDAVQDGLRHIMFYGIK